MSDQEQPTTDNPQRIPKPKARVIAFYLPQYHPIPENDEWWGEGFTEWTNVTKSKPLFPGHEQPQLPGALGFYDLRVAENREKQAELAAAHGVEGFCYWHYWFGGGKRLLERPLSEVVASGSPDFPFCVGWANHDWKGTLMGAGRRLLMKQTYPGRQDEIDHFNTLLPAFQDPRYIQVEGRPLVLLFMPEELPNPKNFTDHWRELAKAAGLGGIFFLGEKRTNLPPEAYGLDGYVVCREKQIASVYKGLAKSRKPWKRVQYWAWESFKFLARRGGLNVFSYRDACRHFLKEEGYLDWEYPCLVPNWDTTPRLGRDALIYTDAKPEYFGQHVDAALQVVQDRPEERRIVFVRSWNEWAEGNYLEPDRKYGFGRLQALKQRLSTDGDIE